MARKRVFFNNKLRKKTTTEMKPARDLAGFGGGPIEMWVSFLKNTSPPAAPFLRGEDFVSWGGFPGSPVLNVTRPQEIVMP